MTTVPPCPHRAPTVPRAQSATTVPPCPTPYRGARSGGRTPGPRQAPVLARACPPPRTPRMGPACLS